MLPHSKTIAHEHGGWTGLSEQEIQSEMHEMILESQTCTAHCGLSLDSILQELPVLTRECEDHLSLHSSGARNIDDTDDHLPTALGWHFASPATTYYNKISSESRYTQATRRRSTNSESCTTHVTCVPYGSTVPGRPLQIRQTDKIPSGNFSSNGGNSKHQHGGRLSVPTANPAYMEGTAAVASSDYVTNKSAKAGSHQVCSWPLDNMSVRADRAVAGAAPVYGQSGQGAFLQVAQSTQDIQHALEPADVSPMTRLLGLSDQAQPANHTDFTNHTLPYRSTTDGKWKAYQHTNAASQGSAGLPSSINYGNYRDGNLQQVHPHVPLLPVQGAKGAIKGPIAMGTTNQVLAFRGASDQGACPPPRASHGLACTYHAIPTIREDGYDNGEDELDAAIWDQQPSALAMSSESSEGGRRNSSDHGLHGRTALTKVEVPLSQLRAVFHLKGKEAAKSLGVSCNLLKRLQRNYGIRRWPQRKVCSLVRLRQAMMEDGAMQEPDRQVMLRTINSNLEAVYNDPNHEVHESLLSLRQVNYKQVYNEKKLKGDGSESKAASRVLRPLAAAVSKRCVGQGGAGGIAGATGSDIETCVRSAAPARAASLAAAAPVRSHIMLPATAPSNSRPDLSGALAALDIDRQKYAADYVDDLQPWHSVTPETLLMLKPMGAAMPLMKMHDIEYSDTVGLWPQLGTGLQPFTPSSWTALSNSAPTDGCLTMAGSMASHGSEVLASSESLAGYAALFANMESFADAGFTNFKPGSSNMPSLAYYPYADHTSIPAHNATAAAHLSPPA